MAGLSDSSTNLSLLASLVRGDTQEETWPIFVEKYGDLLHRWSVRWGASAHDAEEVVQDTLLTIYRKLELYQKQEGVYFRSWLKKVSYRCWLTIVKSRDDFEFLDPSDNVSLETLIRLSRPEARADLMSEFDRMATEEILDFARRRVKARVEESTWACFELCSLANNSSITVADKLGMTPASVIKSVSRTRRMLREEIARLDPPEN